MTIVALGNAGAGQGIPVYLPHTQADAAGDTYTFVQEMSGGAGANETGTGGPISGADLVWTAYGSPPAAVGGYRSMSTSHNFQCTAAFYQAMMRGEEFSFIRQIKNATIATNHLLARFHDGTFDSSIVGYLTVVQALLNGGATSKPTPYFSGMKDGWFSFVKKGEIIWVGHGAATFPTRYEDYPREERCIILAPGFDWSTAFSSIGTYDGIIGGRSTGGVSATMVHEVGTSVISRKALGTPSVL